MASSTCKLEASEFMLFTEWKRESHDLVGDWLHVLNLGICTLSNPTGCVHEETKIRTSVLKQQQKDCIKTSLITKQMSITGRQWCIKMGAKVG